MFFVFSILQFDNLVQVKLSRNAQLTSCNNSFVDTANLHARLDFGFASMIKARKQEATHES